MIDPKNSLNLIPHSVSHDGSVMSLLSSLPRPGHGICLGATTLPYPVFSLQGWLVRIPCSLEFLVLNGEAAGD